MLSAEWRTLAPSLSEALAAGIRNAVLDGQIHPADRLPAERQLAVQLGVSRGTVVAALARLRFEGWLATRHGSGSTARIPASLRLRYAPLSVDHHGQLLDLRRAVPAAPHDAYTAAIRGALADTPRLLLDPRPRAARRLPQRFPGSVRPQPPTPAKGGAGCGP